MCLRSNQAAWCWFLLIVLSTTQAIFADDVANWLEQRGLKQLLVVHLEQQLESSGGALSAEQRNELTLKLASLYAELLESGADPAQRVSLEERGKKLLASAPAAGSDELRLALLRN